MEVGCGNGANLRLLCETAHRSIGLDFIPDVLLDVKRRKGLALVAGDVRTLPLVSESVDGIVDAMVSQHVCWRDHVPLYREYRRVATPDAWLFVYHLAMGTTVTGAESLGSFTWNDLPLFPEAGQTCLPPRWAMEEALADAGWRVREVRALTRTYPCGSTAVYHVIEGEAV